MHIFGPPGLYRGSVNHILHYYVWDRFSTQIFESQMLLKHTPSSDKYLRTISRLEVSSRTVAYHFVSRAGYVSSFNRANKLDVIVYTSNGNITEIQKLDVETHCVSNLEHTGILVVRSGVNLVL